ncbi:CatB-related O-acetyltransferase [Cobetia sp. UIB-001]|uniref:CatB-related O-acetyltransferase n=1 Tax=Cobetia sp. UIB-001 TaxID=2717697 RepID=UPI00384E6D45
MIINKAGIDNLHSLGLEVFGAHRNIPNDFKFQAPSGIKFTNIDQAVSLGAYSYIVSGYLCGVDIGNYCSFGENVQIGRQSHPINWVSTSPFMYLRHDKILSCAKENKNKFNNTKPPTSLVKTEIGNDVWIGHGALILPGVKIGTGSIIAAGSVVTKSVEPYSIVGGNPAKFIRFRVPVEYIKPLLNSKWWEYTAEALLEFDHSDMNGFLTQFDVKKHKLPKIESNSITIGDCFSEK